jgi:hypothetical protein
MREVSTLKTKSKRDTKHRTRKNQEGRAVRADYTALLIAITVIIMEREQKRKKKEQKQTRQEKENHED